jgi:hypothetical protein
MKIGHGHIFPLCLAHHRRSAINFTLAVTISVDGIVISGQRLLARVTER